MNDKLLKQEELLTKMNKAKKGIKKRMSILEEDTKVKRYLKLGKDLDEINDNYDELSYQHVITKCESCDHLFVVSGREDDYYEGRTCFEFGCLKCGIDTHLYEFSNVDGFKPYIEYMNKSHIIPNNNTGLYYDNFNQFLDARKLYLDLKEKNKELSDKKIISIMKKNKEKKI